MTTFDHSILWPLLVASHCLAWWHWVLASHCLAWWHWVSKNDVDYWQVIAIFWLYYLGLKLSFKGAFCRYCCRYSEDLWMGFYSAFSATSTSSTTTTTTTTTTEINRLNPFFLFFKKNLPSFQVIINTDSHSFESWRTNSLKHVKTCKNT